MNATWARTDATITTGGAAQSLASANAARKGFVLANNSSGTLQVAVGGTASASAGIPVAAGTSISITGDDCPNGALSIYGATTAQAFSFYEW